MKYDFALRLGRMFALSAFIKKLYYKVKGWPLDDNFTDYLTEAKKFPASSTERWRYGNERHWFTLLEFEKRYKRMKPEDIEKYEFARPIVDKGSYLDKQWLPVSVAPNDRIIECFQKGYDETMEELKRKGWD